ncbi:MAG: SpoIIE family protein phosphatase [Clostridia bacterium]|nr:SpoIIE family protein phosphatase [Clostridia bacterium]
MKIYISLMLVGLIPIALSVALYFVKKTEFFSNLSKRTSQVIIGVLFGIVAILGTELGVPVGDEVVTATANARDAAPLCAGLLFGGLSGIIAGIIGGVYRFVATYWGAGAYSQIACTVSTIFAGFFGAALRKYMFDDKMPTWPFGLATAVVMEVFHMTVLFLTHLENAEESFKIVQICTLPMIICNAFAVTVSIILIAIFSKSFKMEKLKYKRITQQIQVWLLIVVVVAYFATTMFVYALQTGTVRRTSENIIEISLIDVKAELDDDTDIENIATNRHVGTSGFIIVADSNKKIVSVTEKYKTDLLNKKLSDIGFEDIDKKKQDTSFETTVLNEKCFYMFTKDGDYYIISALSHNEVYATRDSSVYINSYMEVLVFALLFFIIYDLIKRKVVNNIRSVNNSLAKIIDGDLNISVDVNSSEEFCSLSKDINTTVHTLKHYIDEASARIDSELAFAKSIQHSALPSVFPAYPNIKEFDINASMFTAKEVGGDFYDFYMYGENKLMFLIADVSGKGIPAAMFMMRAKTLLKSLSETGRSLEEVFSMANDQLCSGNEAGMFVTAFMCALDIKTGHIDYINAGHNPPFVYRKDKGFSKIDCKAGFILGGMENIKYKMQSIDLCEGDKIFLYTDGVTEAINKNNELFGEDRLVSLLNRNSDVDDDRFLDSVKYSVDAFVNGAEQFDDITMLLLSFNGNGVMKTENKKTFLADKTKIDEVNSFFGQIFDKNEVSMKIQNQILVAVEEIFVNISSYAYQGGNGFVVIKTDIDKERICISFEDTGVPFNPLEKADPDITLSAEDRKIGGLGIFMVKKTMDNVSYQNINEKNIFKIEKKLN